MEVLRPGCVIMWPDLHDDVLQRPFDPLRHVWRKTWRPSRTNCLALSSKSASIKIYISGLSMSNI